MTSVWGRVPGGDERYLRGFRFRVGRWMSRMGIQSV